MTVEFSLPDIGEGLDEAEVVEWHVKPGDTVVRDQPFVDILTDKAQTEMPAPAAGTVVRLGAEVGDIVKVGDLLIVIDDGQPDDRAAGSGIANQQVGGPTGGAPAIALPSTAPAAAPASVGGGSGPAGLFGGPVRRSKASPSTRRLAARLGVDLATVPGSGPGGRILAADVEAATAGPAGSAPPGRPAPPGGAASTIGAAPPGDEAGRGPAAAPAPAVAAGPAPSLGQLPFGVQPLRGIRRATARAMDLSWSTIPHVTAMDELDATELLLARTRAREALGDGDGDGGGDGGAAVTPLALLLVAVARSLRRFPVMNATLDLDDETITVHERINIGVAVASQRGLMVPVVHDADRLGIVAMAAELTRLSTRARDGTIGTADLTGGTFTATNYGSNGGYFAAPIIRPGESGIVGFGAITKRPIVVDDDVRARPVLPLVLSADHRLIDGDVLSAFQRDLSRSISRAVSLLVDPGPAPGTG